MKGFLLNDLSKVGVRRLKIDFIERDDQQGIDSYYRVAKLAARRELELPLNSLIMPRACSHQALTEGWYGNPRGRALPA